MAAVNQSESSTAPVVQPTDSVLVDITLSAQDVTAEITEQTRAEVAQDVFRRIKANATNINTLDEATTLDGVKAVAATHVNGGVVAVPMRLIMAAAESNAAALAELTRDVELKAPITEIHELRQTLRTMAAKINEICAKIGVQPIEIQ